MNLTPLTYAYLAAHTDAPTVLEVHERIKQLAKSNPEIHEIAERMVADQDFYCEVMKTIADLYPERKEPTAIQMIDTGLWFCAQMLDREANR